MIPGSDAQPHARRLAIEITLLASIPHPRRRRGRCATRVVTRRSRALRVESGELGDDLHDAGVEEGEVDGAEVGPNRRRGDAGRSRCCCCCTRSSIGVLDELPWIGENGKEGGGRTEEASEAREGGIGQGVNLEVGGEERVQRGKADGGRHVGEAEEEVGARVEEDGREFRLLPTIFSEALRLKLKRSARVQASEQAVNVRLRAWRKGSSNF